jgi:hypothetical protein
MSRTTAIASDTRCVAPPLRAVYADAARILRDPLAERALEACRRAGIEVVVIGPEELAQELGLGTWIGPDQDVEQGVAAHMETRGLAPEQILRVTDGSFYEAVITEIMLRRGGRTTP